MAWPGRRPRLKRAALMVAAVLGALAVAGAIFAVAFFQRDEPETHADIEEHFKYGSIGAEADGGMPYWIWRVLPDVFADLLPEGDGEGYKRMGFIFESEETIRPIGTSLRRMPVDLLGLNCAACHTATVRDSPEAPPRIVLGTSAQEFDIQAYFNFLFAVARDERFDADILIPAIREVNPDFSRIEELLYRLVVIPQTKERLVERADELALLEERPPIGPGRVDTFFSYKVHFGIRQDVDDPVGTVDFPAIWNQRLRAGMWLHWDGTNDSVEERNLTAALGAGATEESIDHESLQRVTDWISDLKPPEMPRDRIDWSRVPPGRRIYDARCASCHSFGGEDVGDVTPIEDVQTDPNRWQSFTPELAAKLNTFGEGYPWRFSRFRKSDGYANMPLDGIWLRAPYLHNGSVPMLRDLLRPPDERPDVFYRGYDVYDYENVGFVSDGEAASAGFRYDTSVRGNANEGHNYGTDLSEQQVEDLLQFLKTQ